MKQTTSQGQNKNNALLQMLQGKKLVFLGILVVIIAIALALTQFTANRGANESGSSKTYDTATVDSMAGGYGFDGDVAEEYYAREGEMNTSMPSPMPPVYDGNDGPEFGEKIIKNGNLSLVVKDVDQASDQIADIARELGGAVLSQSISENEYRMTSKSGSVRIRVPHNQFEQAFSELKDIADRVVDEHISVDDVTAEFVDLEARLENFRLREEQYRKLLTRANTIEEILQVQQNIDNTRLQIERIEAQLKHLSTQTDFSHIAIYLSTDHVDFKESGWLFGNTINQSIHGLMSGLTDFVDFIVAVVFLIPVILLWTLLILLGLFILYRGGGWVIKKMKI